METQELDIIEKIDWDALTIEKLKAEIGIVKPIINTLRSMSNIAKKEGEYGIKVDTKVKDSVKKGKALL